MTRRIPLYPRIDYAKKMAKEFIIKSKIKSLPINPFAICQHHGFIIKSVSQVEDIINEVDPFDVRENPECDAKTYLTSKGRYIIIYDDSVFSQGRIIWTIAHEIGHIVLKHLTQFDQTEIHKGLTKEENEVLEKEADAFASEFLAPAEVLLNCNCVKKNMIIKLCGLSDEAASYREDYLKNYKPDEKYQHVNQRIYQQFYNFIYNKDYYHILYTRVCPVCKNYIFSTRERFCRICGSSITAHTLLKGIVYNDSPMIIKNKDAIFCPHCFKPQKLKSATTCSYCGRVLVNQCTNPTCNKTQAANSRYCYKCGQPTLFLSNGILPDWKIAQSHYFEKKILKEILEEDKETGKILSEWHYLLSFIKEDDISLYYTLKDTIAKIDYDTLFIYSNSKVTNNLIKEEKVSNLIMKLAKTKLQIPILEILTLKIGEDYSISFEE
ncbi:MAG: hypothetical protein JG780_1823 [Thermosipho sp. (in: Bacteria)]|jgi:Zn-dependent peptidase ImmA (M78 family)|nr:hypothetical protein [Thermosipho sp. (in: thermotogales)]MDK2799768.1 hypothetical protein [Clostridiales bacterium]